MDREVIALSVVSTAGFERVVDDAGGPYYIAVAGEIIGRLAGIEDGKVLVEISSAADGIDEPN